MIDDSDLAPADPLKVGALIRLAAIESREGSNETARALFDRTGLSGDQCALLDRPPRSLSTGKGSFPSEVLNWGINGWTVVQYDIDKSGKPLNERTVIAYPPFVFNETSEGITSRSRFEASFRPEGTLGCGGQTQNVSYDRGF